MSMSTYDLETIFNNSQVIQHFKPYTKHCNPKNSHHINLQMAVCSLSRKVFRERLFSIQRQCLNHLATFFMVVTCQVSLEQTTKYSVSWITKIEDFSKIIFTFVFRSHYINLEMAVCSLARKVFRERLFTIQRQCLNHLATYFMVVACLVSLAQTTKLIIPCHG